MEPLVGIIIGSDSDLGVMSKTAEILDKLEIPYEFSIISAHRTPDICSMIAFGASFFADAVIE